MSEGINIATAEGRLTKRKGDTADVGQRTTLSTSVQCCRAALCRLCVEVAGRVTGLVRERAANAAGALWKSLQHTCPILPCHSGGKWPFCRRGTGSGSNCSIVRAERAGLASAEADQLATAAAHPRPCSAHHASLSVASGPSTRAHIEHAQGDLDEVDGSVRGNGARGGGGVTLTALKGGRPIGRAANKGRTGVTTLQSFGRLKVERQRGHSRPDAERSQ